MNLETVYENFEDHKQSRIARIKALLEEGKSSEEIATALNTKIGSLRAFCHKQGISLRQHKVGGAPTSPKPRGRRKQPQFQLSLRFTYQGRTKAFELELPTASLAMLALEAEFKSVPLAELLSRVVTKAIDDHTKADSHDS